MSRLIASTGGDGPVDGPDGEGPGGAGGGSGTGGGSGVGGDRRIGENCRVTLHFAILLDTGEEVDTTRRGRPATFEVGDGNLLPGFERALFGLGAGDDLQIDLPPAEAFGEHRRENVQLLPRDRFTGVDLEPGLIVSFAAPDGELPGVVRRLFDRTVEVDFNHPLAGRTIRFDVSILKVEPATDVTNEGVSSEN